MSHKPSLSLKPPSPYRTTLQSFLLWLLVVPLGMLMYYAFLYWGLSCLSGERLSFQAVVGRLREALSGGSVLVAMLSGLIGFGTERWRKSVEAENDRARRRQSAIQEVEQLSKALDQRQYGEALTLYRLFQNRCQRGGLWQDINVWEDVRFAWERKAPLPLQTWVKLVEGNQIPELDFVTLEALVWGRRLDPHYWEERSKAFIETLITPNNLASLVRLFSERPESWKSLLRSEVIGRRLAELEQSIPENRELKILQNWREQPPLGIPFPWERVIRPPDSQEFTEWLKRCGFRENPFGPEMAELDPRLLDYGYWPAVLEPARGPRPALVLGAPGFGRTAAALLLHWKCLAPPGNPEEAGTFPVWLEMVDSWPSSPEGWLERLGRVITEALLQVCGQDPYALFSSAEVSNVIAYLFAWYFGPAASVEAHLRRQGLPESALGYVLGEMEIYTGRLSVERSDLTALWDLICRARPAHLEATYVLLDVPTFRPTDADPRIKSLAVLIEMAGPLARRGIHTKLFLPEEAGKPLLDSCPVQPVFLKKWPEEDLREMLQERLIQSSEGTVDTLKAIFSYHDYPPDPDTWLIRSAKGSPRRLVRLGNQMLQEAWKKALD